MSQSNTVGGALLREKSDFDVWFLEKQRTAVLSQIWQYVDPKGTEDIEAAKPVHPKPEDAWQRPIPEGHTLNDIEMRHINGDEREIYKLLVYEYNRKLLLWTKDWNNYTTFAIKLDESIAQKYKAPRRNETPSQLLARLCREMGVDEKTKKARVKAQFCAANKAPNGRQNNTDDLRDSLIEHIATLNLNWWDIIEREEETLQKTYKYDELAEMFNRKLARENVEGLKEATFATVTLNGVPASEDSTTKEGSTRGTRGGRKKKEGQTQNTSSTRRRELPECPYGKRHWWSCCWYLNKQQAPRNFKEDEEIRKKLDLWLREGDNRARVKESVDHYNQMKKDRELQKQAEKEKKKTDNDTTKRITGAGSSATREEGYWSSDNEATHMISLALSDVPYMLRDSVIADACSTVHVTNDMSRFIEYTAAPARVRVGDTFTELLGYGTAKIFVKTGSGSKGMIREVVLNNVAYSPGFHSTIVSVSRLRNELGIDYNGHHQQLETAERKCWACFKYRHGMPVIEYHLLKALIEYHLLKAPEDKKPKSMFTVSTYKPKKAVGSMKLWHQRFAHVSEEAIRYLPCTATGIEIVDTGSKTPKGDPKLRCETCQLANAKAQVSRRPSTGPEYPFEILHADIIRETTVDYNNDKYAIHFYCPLTYFHIVVTTSRKNMISTSIRRVVVWIWRRFGFRVRKIHNDGETSFTNKYFDEVKDTGIEIDESSPYTPEQNGSIERAGQLLLKNSRTSLIGANLPERMWPESVRHGTYIANRTPVKALGWKLPLKVLLEAVGIRIPLSIAHIVTFGCKAFVLNKKLAKGRKHAPRVHISYLVGYDSTNIFRVWIPSLDQVVRTRDVVFDETERYEGEKMDFEVEKALEVADSIEMIDRQLTETDFDLDIYTGDEYHTNLRMQDTNEGFEAVKTQTQDEAEKMTPEPQGFSVFLPTSDPTPLAPQILTTIPVRPAPSNSRSEREPPPEPTLASGQALETPSALARPIPEPQHQDELCQEVNRRLFHHMMTQEASQDIDVTEINTNPDLPVLRLRAEPQDHVTRKRKRSSMTDVDEANIITGKRARRSNPDRLDRRTIFLTTLEMSIYNPANILLTAFMTASEAIKNKPLHAKDLPPPPTSWKELLKHPFRRQFELACGVELKGLEARGTYKKVPRPKNYNGYILPLKWVWTYKFDDDSFLTKALMAIAATFDLDMEQLDAVNAFCNSDIDELVYIEELPGFKSREEDSYRELAKALLELGFEAVDEEPYLFTDGRVFVFFYVDDIVLLAHKGDRIYLEATKARLMERYEMRDLGELRWFLGLRILRDRLQRKVWICQDAYVDKIAYKFGIKANARVTTPLSRSPSELGKGPELSKNAGPSERFRHLYQQKIGSLIYPAVITRPDKATSVSLLASQVQNPSEIHMEEADHVITYLKNTRTLAIEYNS
ncbi:hypothetical protein VTO42DRAFT_7008 [Malbranchea cinnamomea]